MKKQGWSAPRIGPVGPPHDHARTSRDHGTARLNPSEREFVIALARWKARIDIGEHCRRLSVEERYRTGNSGGIRTYDLDTFEYFCEESR